MEDDWLTKQRKQDERDNRERQERDDRNSRAELDSHLTRKYAAQDAARAREWTEKQEEQLQHSNDFYRVSAGFPSGYMGAGRPAEESSGPAPRSGAGSAYGGVSGRPGVKLPSQPLPPATAGEVLALLALDAVPLACSAVWRLGAALGLGVWAGAIAVLVAGFLQMHVIPPAAAHRELPWPPWVPGVLVLTLTAGWRARWVAEGPRGRWRGLRQGQEEPGAGRTGFLLGALAGWGCTAAATSPDLRDRWLFAVLGAVGGALVLVTVGALHRWWKLGTGTVVLLALCVSACLWLGGARTLGVLGGAAHAKYAALVAWVDNPGVEAAPVGTPHPGRR